MHNIQISCAVVTRNRAAALDRCLASLRNQNVQPWELVVSDDSAADLADQTREVTQRWGGLYLAGPRRGLYANRNHAALACRGTHIRTVDDDHTFPASHFEGCLEAVQSDPKAIWTTGEESFLNGESLGVTAMANQLHPSGVGIAVTNPDSNWSIADGSTIYPRSVFARGWRMVEEFSYGSSYLEFGAFLYARGYRSRCWRGGFVEHHVVPETLTRGKDITSVASRLFASLCFNLCFQPVPSRAVRYALSALRSGGFRWRLMASLPHLISQARVRWSAN